MSDNGITLQANLGELRQRVARRLSLLLVAAGALTMWLLLPRRPFPVTEFWLVAGLACLGIAAYLLLEKHAKAARHVLVWGMSAQLAVTMWQFSMDWVPFLGLLVVYVGAMLVARAEVLTGSLVAALAIWLNHIGVRSYPIPGLLVALALCSLVAWITVRTLFTALEWAWTMEVRADELLGAARDRQGELGRALKSAKLTAAILDRTRRELITAQIQADDARRAKEQFAANISHELRTPLNLVLGFSELMYQSPELYGEIAWPPRLRRAVYQIYRSSRHLLELIDDVLALSRLDMTGFALHRESVSIDALVKEAAEIAQDLFSGRPIRMEVEIAPSLPLVEVDRTRIRQVLLNLLSNASRFTDQGIVRIAAAREGTNVVIRVSDTGMGIPREKLPSIFHEFYEVDVSLRRKRGGTGLGLAISRHFVQAHDGHLWVDSEEGVGSTFSFSLPIPGEAVPLGHLSRDQLVLPRQHEIAPSILVVDSDPHVATMVRNQMPGYEVMQVPETSDVGRQVQLHHPQAVVLNVPPGDSDDRGIGFGAGVPVVVCSLPSESWLARELAVAASLTKPVRAAQLRQLVERVGNVRDVLIADDDRGFRQLLEQALEAGDQSFCIRHAGDGQECLEAMRHRRPDLVLLDLMMPGYDGFYVMEQMRKDPRIVDVPVVLLTAMTFAETVLMQRDSTVEIRRLGGLGPADVLRCLQAVIPVLQPRYDERSAPEEITLSSDVLTTTV